MNEQAQSLGWSKATKLAERATAQGLVGVLIHGNIGAMVEVNCETDFVARNEHFKNFVDHVSRICAKYTETTDFDGDLWKVYMHKRIFIKFNLKALMVMMHGPYKILIQISMLKVET